jgi:hypothetical protein
MENNQQKTNEKQKNRTTHTTQKVEVAHSDTKKQLTLTPVTRNGKRKLTIGKQLITKNQN